jgi:hypothetical protein
MTRLRSMVLLCAVTAAGCLASLEPDVGPLTAGHCDARDSDEDVAVSFQVDVLPLLQKGCGCHNPESERPFAIDLTGFSIESVDALMRGGKQSGSEAVVPGDPCASVLVQKVGDAPPFGTRMPMYGPYFDKKQRALLHDWIAEGARDD